MSFSGAVDRHDPVVRLRSFIQSGGYTEGVRLPPERHLTDELGMTRATLRKALDALEREGVIWRHVGKGTFLGARPPQLVDVSDLAQRSNPLQVMKARIDRALSD
jgi:DNA-binding GntR family transcriptional regulator